MLRHPALRTAVFGLLHTREVRVLLVRCQKDLLIVGAGIVLGLDIGECKLAGERSAVEVRHGHVMRVHITAAGWERRQAVAQMAVPQPDAAAFLFGAIHR